MPDTNTITINITPVELTSFCDKLLKNSHDINQSLNSLITLEKFISLYSTSNQDSDAYKAVETSLKSISDKCRQSLLQQSTISLTSALQQCDATEVRLIHEMLSRNDFYKVLKSSIGNISDEELALVIHWTGEWMKHYTQLANDSGEHPDTQDFEKTGVNISEYRAMGDIDRVLNGQH